MDSNESNDTCSDSSIAFVHSVAILSIVLASAVTVFSFLALLVTTACLKKYRFHVQRLVMYLNSAVFVQGFSTLASGIAVLLVTASNSDHANSSLCMASAYLFNFSLWMEIILIGWITLDILLMAGFSLFTNKKMEAIQFLTAVLVPMLVVWIPFLFGTYSMIDGRCDIVTHSHTTCDHDYVGFMFFLLFRLTPISILLVAVFVMYIITFCILRRSRRHNMADYNRREEVAILRRKIGVLVSYPVLYMLFYLLPSLLRFILEYVLPFKEVIDTSPRIAFVVLVTIMQNVGAILISVAFMFDKDTAKRLCQWKNWRNSRERAKTLAISYISTGDSVHNKNCPTSTHT